MSFQTTVTGLGDLFPAGCVAAAITAWCWVNLNRLLALVSAICFLGAVGVTAALKLVAAAYAPNLADAGFFVFSQGAPSGHAVCATAAYGCASILFLRAWNGATALTGFAYCMAVITAVCITRVTLHTHTAADVIAGMAVALCFALLFDRALQAQLRPPRASAAGLLATMIGTALLALASGIRISSAQFL
jgi:membrane-associated phospholipid phosphatase